MDINVTLFGEMLTFAVLVFVIAKYLWPALISAIEQRQQKIAQGIADANKNQQLLENTEKNVTAELQKAKQQAATILAQADEQASGIVDESKQQALLLNETLLAKGRAELAGQITTAQKELQKQNAALVIAITEKLLTTNSDQIHQLKLVDEFIAKL